MSKHLQNQSRKAGRTKSEKGCMASLRRPMARACVKMYPKYLESAYAGGNPQGQKYKKNAPRNERGERGGYDILKRRLISWVNSYFFFAVTALDSKVKRWWR